MTKWIRDNQEGVVLALIVAGMFAMAIGLGTSYRGGQPWMFQPQFDAAVQTIKAAL